MLDHRALTVRRVPRRRLRARSWQDALAWLRLLSFSPTRAPLHLLALAIGAVAVVVTSVGGSPKVSSARQDPGDLSATVADSDTEVAGEVDEVVAQPSLTTYTVEAGDTLLAIGEHFGVSVATIAAANDLDDPDVLEVGQDLVIPPTNGIVHALDSDETLADIGRRYGVDPQVIATVNRMQPATEAAVRGQKLVVPDVEPLLPSVRRSIDPGAMAWKPVGSGGQASTAVAPPKAPVASRSATSFRRVTASARSPSSSG